MTVYKSKSATKDGRQYFFRIKYKDIFGKVHDYFSQKFKTLKEAISEEARYRIKITNNEICTSSVIIEQIFLELMEEKKKNLKNKQFKKKKNDYCKKTNLKQIRIHDFRHSCASLLISKGASITLVSKYLAHANISITLNIYTHLFKNELENVTNILNNL